MVLPTSSACIGWCVSWRCRQSFVIAQSDKPFRLLYRDTPRIELEWFIPVTVYGSTAAPRFESFSGQPAYYGLLHDIKCGIVNPAVRPRPVTHDDRFV